MATGSYRITLDGPLVGAAIDVFNGSGTVLESGALVYISGYNIANDCPTVSLSDANDASKPAMLAMLESVAGSNVGRAQSPALILSYDTTTRAVGDVCYLSTT